MKLSDGIICVTREILEYEQQLGYDKNKPSLVVSNGIDVSSIPLTGYSLFNGKELHLALSAGRLQAWHGIDRILSGMATYGGGVRLFLHLFGNIQPADISKEIAANKATIFFHNQISDQESISIFSQMNLGISTLALHRNNMNEGCCLKTREYMARGLPFILAYHDPDLPTNAPYFRMIELNDDPVNFETIIQFMIDLTRLPREEISNDMRTHAMRYMSWDNKIGQYVSYVENNFGRSLKCE